MKTYKARAVVLHTVKYGDSGLVVYLYTDLFGRQTYMVQGVRSSRGKGNRAALFQPMFPIEFEGSVPRLGDMHRMKDVSASFPLASIPFDVSKSTIALFMAETVYRLIREPQADAALFDFISGSVAALDGMTEGTANFHLWFLVHISYFLGFYPGNEYVEGGYFDISRGLFADSAPSHGLFMGRLESWLLGRLMECGTEGLKDIRLSRADRASFLNSLLVFIGYHSDSIGHVKSIDILREVF